MTAPNSNSRSSAKPRYSARAIAVAFVLFVFLFETYFMYVADHHIVSNLQGETVGSLFDNKKKQQPNKIELKNDFDRFHSSSDNHFTVQSQTNNGQSISKAYEPDFTQFNTSVPFILHASSPGTLPSIPETHLIPKEVLDSESFAQHFSNWNPNKDPPTLFVYNPSIVPIFSTKTTSVVRQQSALRQQNIQYLATFRVSSIHSCGFPTYEFWKHSVDYVGLALLDSNLRIARMPQSAGGNKNASSEQKLDSLDIVVDINAHLPRMFGRGKLRFQDVRLFVLHNSLYMSSGEYLVPICIRVIDPSTGIPLSPGSIYDGASPILCKEGARLSTSMVELPAKFRKNDSLHVYVTGNAIHMKDTRGKNFEFFQLNVLTALNWKGDQQRVPAKVLMEYWPSGPRVIHDLGSELEKMQKQSPNMQAKKKVVELARVNEFQTDIMPLVINASARALDSSISRTFIKRDRSSACCVEIENIYYEDFDIPFRFKEMNSLLVGISHSKSRQRMPSSQGDRYNYLSRMYAFSHLEPYPLIAQSGLFCFGFPGDGDATSDQEVYNRITKRKRLELNGKSYDCPNIHFVSGIAEKYGDSSRVVVAFGINDCVPRFLEFSKRDFIKHLF